MRNIILIAIALTLSVGTLATASAHSPTAHTHSDSYWTDLLNEQQAKRVERKQQSEVDPTWSVIVGDREVALPPILRVVPVDRADR